MPISLTLSLALSLSLLGGLTVLEWKGRVPFTFYVCLSLALRRANHARGTCLALSAHNVFVFLEETLMGALHPETANRELLPLKPNDAFLTVSVPRTRLIPSRSCTHRQLSLTQKRAFFNDRIRH
ncbi:hypothetical protein EVAR_41347_1 [Eumeta japonica]|uniref:Secreted protein n=1 Tax=Eumeta variegata TaxID=151549 RepID=A0A4C1XPK3_EUMVA|nr:hypothetical protein EVAR_41347_1 [Eumeta japonica]